MDAAYPIRTSDFASTRIALRRHVQTGVAGEQRNDLIKTGFQAVHFIAIAIKSIFRYWLLSNSWGHLSDDA